MNGGNSSTALPEPELEFGEMDRMPTMMIGTIRPSVLLGASLELCGRDAARSCPAEVGFGPEAYG